MDFSIKGVNENEKVDRWFSSSSWDSPFWGAEKRTMNQPKLPQKARN
ncbi:hypothetical protein [Neobacillus niacini]|nr:hypothetical protein [Neobacillus niacini]